jgi:hypothetical protein
MTSIVTSVTGSASGVQIEYKESRFFSYPLSAAQVFPANLLAKVSDGGSHGRLFHEYITENFFVARFKPEEWMENAELQQAAINILKVIRFRQNRSVIENDPDEAIWPTLWECSLCNPVQEIQNFIRYGYLSRNEYERFRLGGFDAIGQGAPASNQVTAYGSVEHQVNAQGNGTSVPSPRSQVLAGSLNGDGLRTRRIGSTSVVTQFTWMGELPVDAAVDLGSLVNNISKAVGDASRYDAYADDDLEAVVQRFKFLIETQGATERQAAELVPIFLKGRALRAFFDEFAVPRKQRRAIFSAKEAWDFIRDRFHGKEFQARARKEFEAVRWNWSLETYDEAERTLRKLADKMGITDENVLIMRLRSIVPREMIEEMRRHPYPETVDQQVSIIQTILQQSAFARYNASKFARAETVGRNAGQYGPNGGWIPRDTKPMAIPDRSRYMTVPGKRALTILNEDLGGDELNNDVEDGSLADASSQVLNLRSLSDEDASDLVLFAQEHKPGTCWKCGKTGHRYAECPGNKNEKK